jgi:hypothetical protein
MMEKINEKMVDMDKMDLVHKVLSLKHMKYWMMDEAEAFDPFEVLSEEEQATMSGLLDKVLAGAPSENLDDAMLRQAIRARKRAFEHMGGKYYGRWGGERMHQDHHHGGMDCSEGCGRTCERLRHRRCRKDV